MAEYTLRLKYNLGQNPRINNIEQLPSLEFQTQTSNFLSRTALSTTYCVSFEEITKCLDDNYFVSYNDETIFYFKGNQVLQLELQKGKFIEVTFATATEAIVETNIVLLSIEHAFFKRVQKTEIIQNYLLQSIISSKDDSVTFSKKIISSLFSEDSKLPLSIYQQNLRVQEQSLNRKESQIDILFLIGMSNDQAIHVSCEKEISKVTQQFRQKMGINVSIVSTKDSFRQMLYSKPKIIHIICHGRKAESIQNQLSVTSQKDEIKQAYLEIEDEQGGIYEFKGQKLIQLIEKCNCYPELLILNACHSQEIYEDMLKVKSNKFCNTLIVNRDFRINNTYAYQFISLFYESLLSQLGEQKINWNEGIIKPTKQRINKLQIEKQNKWEYLCCEACKFKEYVKGQQERLKSCGCSDQQSYEYESYESKEEYKEYIKDISKEEFDFFKKFVLIHKYKDKDSRPTVKDEKCYKTSNYVSGSIDGIQLIKNQNHNYYIMLCTSFLKGFNKKNVVERSQYPFKYLTNLIDNHQYKESEPIYKTLLILVVRYFKYAHLQAERYIFKVQKNSKQLSLQTNEQRQSIIIESGPDFLTNPIPKLNIINLKIKNTFSLLKEQKRNQTKYLIYNLKLNYYEQTKAIMLKHLTDSQIKNSSINPQIHIFNISNIRKLECKDKSKEDFNKIFLIDLLSVSNYLKNQNVSQTNMFYLYGWYSKDEELNQFKTKFLKGHSPNIHLYIQNEKEKKYDDLVFYFISQEKSNLSTKQEILSLNPIEVAEAKTYMTDLMKDDTYEKTFKLYSELMSSKKEDPNPQKNPFDQIMQILNERKCDIKQTGKSIICRYKKKTIEEINIRLLDFICSKSYQLNKPLFKYLFKYVQMNHSTFYKFIQYESLTRCLLKVILSYSPKQIEFQFYHNFRHFFDSNPQISSRNDLLSLISIYQTFGFKYFPLNPNQKILARAIILNKNILLNNDMFNLIKSYLLFIEQEFSKNLYNNFRDLIKIHKRILLAKNVVDGDKSIPEIEELLRYLKIKYYFRVAKHNPSYLNLYYINILQKIKNNSLKQMDNQSQLSIVLQSRIIIKMIVFADSKQQNNEDISYILKMTTLFENSVKKVFEKQVRNKNDIKNQMYSLLLHSTVMTEIIKILSKVQVQSNLIKRSSSEMSGTFNDDAVENQPQKILTEDILQIKSYVAHIRSIYQNLEKNITDDNLKNQMEFCFAAYYKMELQIEQPLYNALTKPEKSLFTKLTEIYLGSEEILMYLFKLEKEDHQISKSIKSIISDSILSVQYYFSGSTNNAINSYYHSLEIEKLISQIHNRAIYDQKLLTNDNIENVSKDKTLLKKLVIIDEMDNERSSLAQFYPVVDISHEVFQSSLSSKKESDQKVELLIILNSSDLNLHKRTLFNEKRVIYFNCKQFLDNKPLFKELQKKLLNILLKNLIQPSSFHFSKQIFESIKQMEKQAVQEEINIEILKTFFESVQFKVYNNNNIILNRLCISSAVQTKNTKQIQKEAKQYKKEDFAYFFQQVNQKHQKEFKNNYASLLSFFGKPQSHPNHFHNQNTYPFSQSPRPTSFPLDKHLTPKSQLSQNFQTQNTPTNNSFNNIVIEGEQFNTDFGQNTQFNTMSNQISMDEQFNNNMNIPEEIHQNVYVDDMEEEDDDDYYHQNSSQVQQSLIYLSRTINR